MNNSSNKKKISEKELQEIIHKGITTAIFEAKDTTGAGHYAKKLDEFISEMVDKTVSLVKEGEEIILDNPHHDYAIQERNHSVISRIGVLHALKTELLRIMENVHRAI